MRNGDQFGIEDDGGRVFFTIPPEQARPVGRLASAGRGSSGGRAGRGIAAPTATKCRFKEVDATNHPGVYEFQFADARFAVSNAKRLVISASGVLSGSNSP